MPRKAVANYTRPGYVRPPSYTPAQVAKVKAAAAFARANPRVQALGGYARARPRAVARPRAAARSSGNSALGTAIGSALGMALGGPAGGAMGGMIGNAGGGFLSKIFGHGDYAVSNASSLKQNNLVLSNSANIPQFGTGKVATKFVHREFLGDVFSSSTANTFKIDSYAINPGQSETFPWLAGVVGAKYQQYRINGMTFEFRSMSADALNSTNTALGSVIMSTDYDSADVVFSSKQQMENTENGVSCKPSVNMMHGIECARAQTPVNELYIRAFDVPSGKDIRLYDLGRFSIASTGCQGTNVNLGELWVSYDIDAFKAIEQVPAYLTPFSTFALQGMTATAPLGTSRTAFPTDLEDYDQIGLTFVSENKVTWPLDTQVGANFFINYVLVGAAAAALTQPVITTGGGMKISTVVDFIAPASAVTTAYIMGQWAIQYQGGGTPAAPPYFNIADFTWAPAGGVLEADFLVTQVSGNFASGTYTLTTGGAPPVGVEDPEDTDYVRPPEEQKKALSVSHSVRRR
nr:putative capsid protein [Crucivirus sp.]